MIAPFSITAHHFPVDQVYGEPKFADAGMRIFYILQPKVILSWDVLVIIPS